MAWQGNNVTSLHVLRARRKNIFFSPGSYARFNSEPVHSHGIQCRGEPASTCLRKPANALGFSGLASLYTVFHAEYLEAVRDGGAFPRKFARKFIFLSDVGNRNGAMNPP